MNAGIRKLISKNESPEKLTGRLGAKHEQLNTDCNLPHSDRKCREIWVETRFFFILTSIN
jgi:hypothetical protein